MESGILPQEPTTLATTKTPNHTISRTEENVGPFGLFDSAKKTTIHDEDTGARDEGYGRTRQEADDRAWDRVRSDNEARKR